MSCPCQPYFPTSSVFLTVPVWLPGREGAPRRRPHGASVLGAGKASHRVREEARAGKDPQGARRAAAAAGAAALWAGPPLCEKALWYRWQVNNNWPCRDDEWMYCLAEIGFSIITNITNSDTNLIQILQILNVWCRCGMDRAAQRMNFMLAVVACFSFRKDDWPEKRMAGDDRNSRSDFGRQERYQDFDHRDRGRYQDDLMMDRRDNTRSVATDRDSQVGSVDRRLTRVKMQLGHSLHLKHNPSMGRTGNWMVMRVVVHVRPHTVTMDKCFQSKFRNCRTTVNAS